MSSAATDERAAHRRARELLRGLDLPAQAPQLLTHPRYWTPELGARYCAACDEALTHDVATGLEMARIAPRLAQLLPQSPQRRQLRVRALAVLGHAQRLAGQRAAAESSFQAAFDMVLRGSVERLPEADLHRRYSSLLIDRGLTNLAAAAAQRAVELLAGSADAESSAGLGAALVQRGIVHLHRQRPAGAVEDFGVALAALDPRRHGPAYGAAVQHLVAALGTTQDLGLINRASHHLIAARRRLRGRRRCPARYQLDWAEAALLGRVGAHRRAEQSLLRAYRGFSRLGPVTELLRVCLELADLYRGRDQRAELRQLARDALAQCRRRRAGADLLDSVAAWQRAASGKRADGALLEAAERHLARSIPPPATAG